MSVPRLSRLAAEAGAEQARRSLTDFLALLRPGYERAAHLELLAAHLQALAAGDLARLMVLMPPRHGKSLHVSQAFPAWYLGHNPSHQVIIASYGAELAETHSRAARALVCDPRYPFATTVAAEASAVGHWQTAAGGALIAAGIGGSVTGFGANLLLIDDPVKDHVDADSQASRNRVGGWYTDVALTRLMPAAKVLVTMTRWNSDDLGGRILESSAARDWTVLRLPALAEADDPLQRLEGEALWPSWYSQSTLAGLRDAGMSARSFAAIYQQSPSPEQGTLLRREWLTHHYIDPPAAPTQIVQSIDSAFKTGVANDHSVISTWAVDATNYFLLNIWRGRVEFPELIRQIVAQADRHRPQEILVEDAASGQSAIQQLRHDTRLPVIAVRPEGTKESRLAAVSGLFEAGKVLLPTTAPWLDEWVEEHVAFPAGRHDDQVDATSLALGRLRTDSGPRIRMLRGPIGDRWLRP
jgi:predicted phage terminase large subunit-like protein